MAKTIRSATCFRLVVVLVLAVIGFIFLQPLLAMGNPFSRRPQNLRQNAAVNEEQEQGGLERAPDFDPIVLNTELTAQPTDPVPPPQAPTALLNPFAILFEDVVIKKQTFSPKLRIVFLVGLEGTGHHYMADVLENVCKNAQIPCPKMCTLGKVIYPDLSKPKTAYNYKHARERLREEMQNLALKAEELPEGKSSIASFGPCRFDIGMLSYPNFNGPEKTLQYVDLKIVVEEAERAGIDLRIIYLTRQAKSILISDTMHHNYGSTFIMEARVLMTNAAVMESYFNEIDPAFTTCFRYENITSNAQAERVSRFIAPTEYAAERLQKFMLAAVKTRSSTPGHWRFRGRRLYRALEERESSPRAMDGAWPRTGGAEGEGVGPSAAAEDWRWLKHHRALGEKLTDGQDMITRRLQQKIDILDRKLCM